MHPWFSILKTASNMLEEILPSKLFEILDKNGLCTSKQLILLSSWDIKKATNLSRDDIEMIKNIVSEHTQRKRINCDKILRINTTKERVSLGCKGIDTILNGGLRRGALTEIYGESGSGKTQIGLQSIVYNWARGCVYICTEDIFPVRRYEQIKSILHYSPEVDYGKNTFIEHITESEDLLSCVTVRLPKLLSHKQISLIVIDSVAAPFRVESTDYKRRADELRMLGNALINIARVNDLAILCINQVTAAFNDSSSEVLPSLGLAWSNMICTRLWLKKTHATHLISENKVQHNIRELSVEFAPDLPFSIARFIVTSSGINAV